MALTPIRQMDLSIHGKMLSVIESLLADSAVSTDKIAASAVVENKLADSAVTTSKIADASVTEAKIAPNTITNASIAQTASISDAALDVISSAGKVANSATTATSANTADAIVARDANGGFSAGDVNVADLSASGDLSVTGSSALTGDLNVNAGKFVVTAATGALDMDGALGVGGNATLSGDLLLSGDASVGGTLAVTGDLSVDTNKFTVAAATGNTIVGGTLSVSGESTLTGNVLASGDVTIQGNLAVNGTTTSVNSVDLVVNDRLVHLNEPATAGANDPVPTGLSGISIHRGSDAGVEREHAGMVWDEAGQKFVFQLLDADAAGSAKLDLEAKDIQGEALSLNKQIAGDADLSFTVTAGTGYTDGLFLHTENLGDGRVGEVSFNSQRANFDFMSATDNTWLAVKQNQFHVERTDDNYTTYSQFDIEVDGVQLRDGNGDALLPTADEHLVVKKYVDDATDAMQGNVDLKYDKAGGAIDVDGTVQLSITDGASSTLSGDGLSIVSDHVVNLIDANVTTAFALDSISMQYLDDNGDVFIGNMSSGQFNVSSTIGGDVADFLVSSSGMSAYTAVGNDTTEIGSTAQEINLRASANLNNESVVMKVQATGASLVSRDASSVETVLMPTADEHLVVKKYVDDADAGLQDSVDELYDKSGIVIGTQNTFSTTNVVANGDSLVAAIGKIDLALADIAGKSYHEAFIYAAAGGETSLNKPLGAPAIPDSAFTEVYIDGRKVFRGADKQFTVAVGGGSIEFAALAEGQTVELRYFA